MKKLKQKFSILRNTKTTISNGKWQNFAKLMANLDSAIRNKTRTDNPKGKVGAWEYKPYWARDFVEGNKKWFFRKFEKKPFDNAEGFIIALAKRGFTHLGSGAFATVLGKEGSDRVIKVIRRPDGWINYIHWAAQIGEAGHFAPRVFSYKKIKGRDKDFSVAVMERLSYTLEDTPEDHAMKILPGLLWQAETNEMAAKFTETLAPGLLTFTKKMSEQWKIPVQNFDLHSGNLMIRVDGSFVIVDPVSKGEDKYDRLRVGDLSPILGPLILSLIGFLIESSNRHRGQRTN
jgi:hypothetical protein